MKKLLAILFIIVFSFNLIGHFIVFKAMQRSVRKQIKREIKNNVPSDQLTLLKISQDTENDPNSGFKRFDDNEFRWQGNMYDVVRKEMRGDVTWYYCILDTQETGLFASLDRQVKEYCENNGPVKEKSRQLLKNPVKEAIPDTATRNTCMIGNNIFYSEHTIFYHSISLIIPSPPPKPAV